MIQPMKIAAAALAALLMVGAPPAPLRWDAAAQDPLVSAPYLDAAGTTVGTVSVLDIEDPWESPTESLAAPEGSRYVVMTVMVDADAEARFEFGSRSIAAQDTDGRLLSAGYLPVPDDSPMPPLEDASLAPGSRIIGLIGFAVPDGADIARLWFTPTWNQLLPFATLTGAPEPAAGDDVEVEDQSGNTAQVTVTSIVMPFTEFAEGSAYEDGTVPALVTLTFENTGERTFTISPNQVVLYDRAGKRSGSEQFSRNAGSLLVPNLAGVSLAPGDRATGAVGFRLAQGAEPGWLAFEPETNRFMIIGAIGAGDVAQGAATPVPDSSPDPSPIPPPMAQGTVSPESAGPGATAAPSPAEPAPEASVCTERDWLAALQADLEWASTQLSDPAALNYAALPEIIDAFQRRAAMRVVMPAPPAMALVNSTVAYDMLRISQELQDLRDGYAAADLDKLNAQLSLIEAEKERLDAMQAPIEQAISSCPA